MVGELLGRRKVCVGEYQVRDGAIKTPACGGGNDLGVCKADQ